MTVASVRAGYAPSPSTGDPKGGYQNEPEKEGKKPMVDGNGVLKEIDLRANMLWPLRNQLSIPACTAYAAMACVELYLAVKNKKDPTPLSAAEAYYEMEEHAKKDEQHVRAKSPGFTRFKDAVEFLNRDQYHTESQWSDQLTEAKPENLDAPEKREIKVCYHSYPPSEHADWWLPEKGRPTKNTGRPTNSVALAIYKELLNDRPVGAGFPAYTRPEGHGMTNWTSAFENGIVGIPRIGDALDMEAGHAVCIVGFTGRGEKIKPSDKSKIEPMTSGRATLCSVTALARCLLARPPLTSRRVTGW